MSQNILSTIVISLIVMMNFSSSFSLTTPIPALAYKNYTFHLDESSKYIIYSFKSEEDITNYELVFRINQAPTYSTKFFVYYSQNDISSSIDSIITYDQGTGEFFNSIYSTSLDQLKKMNYEVVLNSSNCDAKNLKPGYFYAVISIVSDGTEPEYASGFVVFNTLCIPEISISDNYKYFKLGGPYKNNISFHIPTLTKDVFLNLMYKTTAYFYKKINIYKNKLGGELYNSTAFNPQEYNSYCKLIKGYDYYIQIQNECKFSYEFELLFQFPSNELVKLQEGMTLYTSTIIDYYYYFYYDCSKMKAGDELFIQILSNIQNLYLYYLGLDSNDYNFVYNKRNTYMSKSCKKVILTKDGISSSFYNCGEFTDYKAVLFQIRLYKGTLFSNYKIRVFSRKDIINPENLIENYQNTEIGLYLLSMEKLSAYDKNILIYSNRNQGMNIYCFNFDFSFQNYNGYRYYDDIKLFFIDPSNPETENTNSYSNPTKYYTIIIYNPLLEDYSINIKFINKNIYFIREFAVPLQESIIRKSYYTNESSILNIYQTLKFIEDNGENVNKYSMTFHELYGDFETEMIVLDNINAQTLDEFINEDFSLNQKYVTSLADCSNIGKYILTHIKINANKESQFYDHIAFYQNILKMNTSYTEKLKEGEEIRLFPKRGEESIIYFDSPYSNFNYEIKFLGRANSSDYNMNIIDCEGIQKTLDNNNKIIRGNCKNVDYKTKITLTNNGIALTGIIIKRAFSKNLIKQIINNSLNNELNVGRDLTLIKYEKNLNNLFYFYNYVNPYSDNSLICLYQDYLDIDYLSYPSKYSCFVKIANFSSYQNLSIDYNMIYNENNSKGKLIDSDYLYLIINSSKYNNYINFRKIFKINATNMESKDIISESDYDGYFYIMPKKTNINNYNSLFLQAFEKNSYQVEFKLYKNLQIFSKFSISTSNNYENYNIQEINIENQLMLYIEHSRNSLFRFIFYNSEIDEYNNYDYKSNLITSNYISLQIKDKTIFPYKFEIKPNKPHEIKGCSNYYFFALKSNYNPSIQNYYNFCNIFIQKVQDAYGCNGKYIAGQFLRILRNRFQSYPETTFP